MAYAALRWLWATLLDLLDYLGEGFEVTGIARGDNATVDDDLRIFPFRAGVDDVRLD